MVRQTYNMPLNQYCVCQYVTKFDFSFISIEWFKKSVNVPKSGQYRTVTETSMKKNLTFCYTNINSIVMTKSLSTKNYKRFQ